MNKIGRGQNSGESSFHVPVMVKEVIQYLNPKPNQNFIDATLGTGGHAEKILLKNGPQGELWGFDLDEEAIQIAKKRLAKFTNRVKLFRANFTEIKSIINEQSRIHQYHGFLLDLGVSSLQLRSTYRGFSFQTSGPINMRFDQGSTGLTAENILNNWPEETIKNILKEYGEERYSGIIAQEIVFQRKKEKFHNTNELVKIIEKIYSNKPKPKHIHPATKTFQALRISVNDELNNLEKVLPQALDLLAPQGRLVVISFHSLEARIIKKFFQKESRDCLCPPEFPVCRCNHLKKLKILTKKALVPSWEEIKQNFRSRSAELRSAEKLVPIRK